MTEATERDTARPILMRCLVTIGVLGVIASMAALLVAGPRPALAVALGSTLAATNLWLLAILVRRWLSPAGSLTAWGLLLPVKLAALVAVLYALVAARIVQPVPLLVGFALLPFAILVAQLRSSAVEQEG
ncbi:MAG: hypothetical protein JW940_11895 [Polyangiaceae bacterium]|nr:hypothetical protein [Polyangiaceae bacterium]